MQYKRGMARDHQADTVLEGSSDEADEAGALIVAQAEQVLAQVQEREQSVWRLQLQIRELQGNAAARETRAGESKALALQVWTRQRSVNTSLSWYQTGHADDYRWTAKHSNIYTVIPRQGGHFRR